MKEQLCEIPESNPPTDEVIAILRSSKKIAVVGLSPKANRDSNRVAQYLIRNGYEVLPINPGQKELLERRCYKSLMDIPFDVDLVNLFVNSERISPIVDQAIDIKAKAIWMQLGIVNNEAALKANEAGIKTVMNKCIMIEHNRFKDRL